MSPSPFPTSRAAESSEQGKLFVGGIASETREDELSSYFSRYGEVKEAVVMRDRYSGHARGFGFVQFVDSEAAERALADEGHVVGERTVEVRRAIIRRYQNNGNQQNNGPRQHGEPSRISTNNGSYNGGEINPKKIFVGGLPETLTNDEFKSYFEKFGKVMDTVVMYDNATHRPRGFGFITFDTEEAVQNVFKSNSHELNGKNVDVKIAVPKDGTYHRSNGSHDRNSHNSRVFDVRGQDFTGYQGGFYPSYVNRYGYPPAIYSPYVYGPFGYSGYGYGVPLASPRHPWSIPYGSAHFYPGYVNGRFGNNMNIAFSGYDQGATSVNEQENQVAATVPAADTAPSQPEVVSLDA